MIKNIFLTGKPRTGKTTLLKEIIKDLNSCGGFYTEEIIQDNKRIGFRLKTLDGKVGILAKEGLKSRYKLSKYGINLQDLEDIGVKAIQEALEDKEIIVIDEIGIMEFFSERFKSIILKALDSERIVIGVVHHKLQDLLNLRKDTKIFKVNLNNHKEILSQCRSLLQNLSILKTNTT